MNIFPIKITPCPIIEATIELRFSSDLPKGAVFGIIYNSIKDTFGKVEKLPTANLPIEIMENDPNLRYKALYKLTDGLFNAQIGYDVVTFHAPSKYLGWRSFKENIIVFYKKIMQSGILTLPESISLRYLNFFDFDIYNSINLNITLFSESHKTKNLVFRTEFIENDFTNILQVANSVTLSGAIGKRQGSIIDITCVNHSKDIIVNGFDSIVEDAHSIEKKIFFQLLKPDFIDTLNPEYPNGQH